MGSDQSSPVWRTVLEVRLAWLIILAFVIQLVAISTITDPSSLTIKKAMLVVTSLMLLVGIVPNLGWWSFRVLVVGFLLNTLVIFANGGLMPVTPENHARVLSDDQRLPEPGRTPPNSKNILLETSDTRLSFLSDTIYVSVPTAKVYSFGDMVLLAGVATFLVEVTARVVTARRRLAEQTQTQLG